ncbi:2,5-didehydrogluconate reductase DkgB [Salinimonas chungwhensis]|uniref:2,5-didehydrogluconate reductase DkgB n=1 Tax=Salinimonas chungwhensis TaxID=265425 RepID=UPI00037AEE57|nr:2,5-didehydrogluconate reductase DkgB [Salinimonas chungwhensis]
MQDMPQLGIGTFRLEDDTAHKAVVDALKVGFRHVDTAQIYGNEEQVGDAIRTQNIDRDDVFITTKVWFDHFGNDSFIASVHESLAKLKVDYVDLLLVHWPSPHDKVPMEQYLNSLKQAKDEGLTRHIGVSNFTIAQMEKAVEILGEGEIYTNQVELHPYMQNRGVAERAEELGMKVTAYMPFAVGKVMDSDVLKDIGNKFNATPAQVTLAWMKNKGYHTIPSSTNPDHIKDNFEFDKVKLSDEDMERIGELDNGERIVDPDFGPEWD